MKNDHYQSNNGCRSRTGQNIPLKTKVLTQKATLKQIIILPFVLIYLLTPHVKADITPYDLSLSLTWANKFAEETLIPSKKSALKSGVFFNNKHNKDFNLFDYIGNRISGLFDFVAYPLTRSQETKLPGDDVEGATGGATEDPYFAALIRGELPNGRPRQRILTLSDFGVRENIERLFRSDNNIGRAVLKLPEFNTLSVRSSADVWYLAYLAYVEAAQLYDPDETNLLQEQFSLALLGPDSSRLRQEFGMYHTPSSEWLNPVVEKLYEFVEVPRGLEVFAGNGSLSYFLNGLGITMEATNLQQSHRHVVENSVNTNLSFPVINEGAVDAVNKVSSG